jgi:hypothetical protein
MLWRHLMTQNHFLKQTKRTCLTPESMYAQIRGCESMHARMEEPESMHARMWGGLLQDTGPMSGMVHCFVYVIIFAQHFLAQYALHLYNISCIVVTELWELHWWHHSKVKVECQGHIMVKVDCQRNPYFLSSFYQIIQTFCESSIWSATQLNSFWDRSALTFMGLAAGKNMLTPSSNFEIDGTIRYYIVEYLIWKPLTSAFQINKNFDIMTS